MLFGKGKIKKIIEKKDGQNAIMDIDAILSKDFYSGKELSQFEKNIVYIEEMEREVNNGGFSQFFFNNSGSFANELVLALTEIGSKDFLNIIEESIAIFPKRQVPVDEDERQKIVSEFSDKENEKLEILTQRFLKYEEDIYSLMLNYINANIKEFR